MEIKIGDNNKIRKSIIGNNNKKEETKENKFLTTIVELLIAVSGGLIVGYFVFKFGWNK